MNEHVLYILVRNDPYAFGELTSLLPRQSKNDFDTIAVVTGMADGKLASLLKARTPFRIETDERNLATALTEDIARRKPKTVTIIDAAYLPSNTVWFERLVAPLLADEAKVVLSRTVHDLYTNWLVQNDFVALQHETREGAPPSPFLYSFAAVSFKPDLLADHPLPGATLDTFLLRWAATGPGPALLVHDALTTHLHPITPAAYIAAHQRYAALASPAGGTLGYALRLFTSGLARDIRFALDRRRPQWLLYAAYLRTRMALGVLLG